MVAKMSRSVNDIRVQFLAFDGCPLAEAARKALDEAVAASGLAGYEEIDILDPNTPEDIRGWGSPTILVNGDDVTGNAKGEGVGCRIYATESRVPEADLIVERIREAQPAHE
jgi:hypothetical protein